LIEKYGLESGESEASKLGTMAHEIAAKCLSEDRQLAELLHRFPHPDLAKLAVYIDLVRSEYKRYKQADGKAVLRVEKKVRILPDCYGTPDAQLITPVRVIVYDLKFGTWPVQAVNNTQLLTYHCGVLPPYKWAPKVREQVIVQPRAKSGWPTRRWAFSPAKLVEHRKAIETAVKAIPTAKAEAGADQCQWCPVKDAGKCSAYTKLFGA
jgi:hypothetical protein